MTQQSAVRQLATVLRSVGVPDHTTVAIASGSVAAAAPQRDAMDAQSAESQMRTLWGSSNVQKNVERINAYLDTRAGKDAADLLRRGRDPESGTVYGNDPELLVRLAAVAKAPQPEAMTVEGVEKFMRTNRSAYDRDEHLQGEYRRLLVAREQGGG